MFVSVGDEKICDQVGLDSIKSFKRRCGLAMHNDSVNDIDMHDTCMHNAARQWVFDPQPNVCSANNYFS
jgi:hypothetical protein